MKRKPFDILGLPLVLILVFNVTPTFSTISLSSITTIYLAPSNIAYTPSNASVGTLFNVTVKVENVADLACFEVMMYFNDSIINVTSWYEPTDNPEYVFHEKTTLPTPPPPDYDYTHHGAGLGSAHVGCTVFPAPSPGGGFHGNGTLMIFEFNITAVPEDGAYSCDLSIDNEDTFLLTSLGEEITPVTKENGYYMFISVAPPTETRLYVDPPEIIDPTMVPSLTFSIDITIDDVENMRVCVFNLTYDTRILGWFGINIHRVQGEMPSPSVDANDEAGYIWIKLLYPTSVNTSDPLPLVTVAFHVEAMGATTLELQDTELLDSDGQRISHEASDGFFMTQIHDVAIINVVTSQNWTYPNRLVNITVIAKNLGNESETFDVKAYGDTILINTVNVIDLAADAEVVLVFTWNTSSAEPCHNYKIRAEATTVPYEFNTTNNVYVDGVVRVYFLGDVNRDDKVNMADIYIVIQAFGSFPGHLRWNVDADIDQNNKVNMRDIYKVIKNFGEGCDA